MLRQNTAILSHFLIFDIRQLTQCEDSFWGMDWGQHRGSSKKQSIHQKNQIPFPIISIKHCLGFLTIDNLFEEPS